MHDNIEFNLNTLDHFLCYHTDNGIYKLMQIIINITNGNRFYLGPCIRDIQTLPTRANPIHLGLAVTDSLVFCYKNRIACKFSNISLQFESKCRFAIVGHSHYTVLENLGNQKTTTTSNKEILPNNAYI